MALDGVACVRILEQSQQTVDRRLTVDRLKQADARIEQVAGALERVQIEHAFDHRQCGGAVPTQDREGDFDQPARIGEKDRELRGDRVGIVGIHRGLLQHPAYALARIRLLLHPGVPDDRAVRKGIQCRELGRLSHGS